MKASSEIKKGKNDIGWVSPTFWDVVKDENVKPPKSVEFVTLEKDMTDDEIANKIGECTLSEVVAFFKNPPEGTKNGNINIFILKDGPVVVVHWYSGLRLWLVDVWGRDGFRWNRGHRAFPQLDSKKLGASDPSVLSRLEKIEEVLKHHNLGL